MNRAFKRVFAPKWILLAKHKGEATRWFVIERPCCFIYVDQHAQGPVHSCPKRNVAMKADIDVVAKLGKEGLDG
jgi:hypothetical protein